MYILDNFFLLAHEWNIWKTGNRRRLLEDALHGVLSLQCFT